MIENTELTETLPQALIVRERSSVLLMPVMNLATAQARLKEFQEFVQGYLQPSEDGGQDGGDYGTIPGAGKKRVLLKSGADKLCELYGLYDEYEIQAVEDFDTNLFYYKIKCILKSRRDDSTVGTGVGSCSTYESKYRWRDSQRKCPKCDAATIIKGKDEFGGGWLCWAKKGGCGAKFKDDEKSIMNQVIGRVENPDLHDTVNTVLKMAKKRAKIDAVIAVTRSSGIFTQDLEEMQPATAKPVEVSTEPKTYTRSAAINKDQGGKPQEGKPPVAAEISTSTVVMTPAMEAMVDRPYASAPVGGEPAVEKISGGQAANFHKSCRAAVSEKRKMEADDLTYKWLGDNGYRDKDGLPTASLIPAAGWMKVRDRACEWLSQQ